MKAPCLGGGAEGEGAMQPMPEPGLQARKSLSSKFWPLASFYDPSLGLSFLIGNDFFVQQHMG